MTINRTVEASIIAAQPGTHLVYLGADWCNYCQFTKPAVEELGKEGLGGIASFNVYDSDEDIDSAMFIKMKTVPQVVLYRDGQEIARRGSGHKDELRGWINEQIAA